MSRAAVREDGAEGNGRDRRILSVGVGATIAILLLTFALVFANAFGATRVAENARALHWTNATLGAAAIARASNAQAVVYAIDDELGVTTSDAAASALAEARLNMATLDAWSADGAGAAADTPAVVAALEELASVGDEVLMLLATGDVAAAAELNQTAFEAAHARASEALGLEQDTIFARIDDTENIAGTIGTVTRLGVTLLIPGAAIVIYRLLVRRQARRREQVLERRIAVERELHQAKDEFIASISHEIRTPLTSIYGFSEILVDQGLLDTEGAMELIELINVESGELSRMVEDLLTAARLDARALNFTFAALDPAEELATVVSPFLRSASNIEVRCEAAPLWADQIRFHQVIRNLVSNAVKHGGPNIAVHGGRDGMAFVCTVSDDGDGIPAEYEERIFERFVHSGDTPLLVGSIGLGLAIASSLTETMGGSLAYERAGGTTRFTVRLPGFAPANDVAPGEAATPLAVTAGDRLSRAG